jgi:hypothetical protein
MFDSNCAVSAIKILMICDQVLIVPDHIWRHVNLNLCLTAISH